MHKFKVGEVVRAVSSSGDIVSGRLYKIYRQKPSFVDDPPIPRYSLTDLLTNEDLGDQGSAYGYRENRFEKL